MAKAKIIVAEDDGVVRELVARWLRSAGYTVLSAATGDEALGFAEAEPDLLIADLVLPPSGGLDLAELLSARVSRLAVLHISGYAARPEFNSDPHATLLSKPFTKTELIDHVECALAARSGA